jgi:membrane-associated HD superfamily phosphohydrolase
MHNTLFAPYSFAIQKSEAEFQHEKDSLLKEQVPYFVFADSISKNQVLLLNKNIEGSIVTKSGKSVQLGLLKLKLCGIYNDLYNKGIIDQNFANNPVLSKKGTLKILKNNIGKEIYLKDIYTLKSAYSEVNTKIAEMKTIHPDWADYLNNFQPENFLASNLIFDQEKNKQIEDKALENLSANHGIVQEGERIASQGDIISAATFSILESLRTSYEKSRGENSKFILVIWGRVLLIMVLLLTLYLFLLNIRRKLMRSKRDISFILVTLSLMIILCSLVIKWGTFDIYIVPFTILALIIRTFLDTRVAIFVNTIATLIVGFIVPNGYEFVLLQIPAGSIAVISLSKMQKREQLLLTALLLFASYSAIFIGFSLIQEANLNAIEWVKIKYFAINAVLTLITYLLVYILEKPFGFDFHQPEIAEETLTGGSRHFSPFTAGCQPL